GQGLAGVRFAEAERVGDRGPGLVLRPGREGHELDLRARLAAEAREVALEDEEERRPSLLDALEMLVPLVPTRGPGMNDTHATGAAGLRLDRPLVRHRG